MCVCTNSTIVLNTLAQHTLLEQLVIIECI